MLGTEETREFPHWESPDGSVLLVNGDCMQVLPTLPAGAVDCVVTDPPYGMNATSANMNRGNSNCRWALPTAKSAWPTGGNEWDDQAPKVVLDLPTMVLGGCIIWGGQFFELPTGDSMSVQASSHTLLWKLRMILFQTSHPRRGGRFPLFTEEKPRQLELTQ